MMAKLKNITLPLLIVRGITIFPKHKLIIDISSEKNINSCRSSQLDYESKMVVIAQKNNKNENVLPEDLHMAGTLCSMTVLSENAEGKMKIRVEGIERFKQKSIIASEKFNFVEGTITPSIFSNNQEEFVLTKKLKEIIERVINNANFRNSNEIRKSLEQGLNSGEIADLLSSYVPFIFETKQKLLATLDVNNRLTTLIKEVEKQKQIKEIEKNIEDKIKNKISDSQREYYLRERYRAIQEELGIVKSKDDDSDNIKQRVENNPYPAHIKEKILEELSRYETSPSGSSEANIIKSYIDTLLNLPWWEKTTENHNINRSKEILEKSHFGLDKVKERIIEHLAVHARTKANNGPIICLVGPPGVGKTSLAKSIAEAVGRKYIKISLGGLKDESEIRGHRKTYIGAMPGRIINAMKKAKVINPLILLDEVDKMAADYRGDPASALLEVLDPEQNKHFSDNYIEEEYDLSNVMFIATANYIENIPEALIDRMEIISLNSYTELEKLAISTTHLIPEIMQDYLLKKKEFSLTKAALKEIIMCYTKEAGVRQLKRLIQKAARKAVVKLLANKNTKGIKIDTTNLKDYLGIRLFEFSKREKLPSIGVVTGLAWTQYGGDILPIEVTIFKGKGKIHLTGKLGDVMKESAIIALGYIKSNAARFSIDLNKLENSDLHIHVPEGAVPKDGPSAGITMTTAMLSAFVGIKISPKIAMTGEITLRGNVLAIGGLKEKLISANRSKITRVFIPSENKKHLEEVPQEVLKHLEITPVSHYEEVFSALFGNYYKEKEMSSKYFEGSTLRTSEFI